MNSKEKSIVITSALRTAIGTFNGSLKSMQAHDLGSIVIKENIKKSKLKNYYKNKGFYKVEIKSSNVEYSEGEGFVLTYNINAGKRYKFGKTR